MPIRRNNVRLMGIDAGQRDRKITIEQRPAADTLDTEGAPIDGPWTTLVDCMPAAKHDMHGEERMRGDDRIASKFDTRWVINYRLDMDPELLDVPKLRRVKVGDRYHQIVAAAEIGRRQGIEIMTVASTKVPT